MTMVVLMVVGSAACALMLVVIDGGSCAVRLYCNVFGHVVAGGTIVGDGSP